MSPATRWARRHDPEVRTRWKPKVTFVNPVCGVAVSTTAPVHVETYEGEAFYFCCDGCWVDVPAESG